MSKEEGNGKESSLWENQSWVLCQSRKLSRREEGKESVVVMMADQKKSNKRNNGNMGKETDDSDGKEEKGSESDHEMHIWTERERRKKMRNMFSNLHALLPQLPPKADKSTIVDEAINYIKTLEKTLQKLEKEKLERGATTFCYEPSLIAPQRVEESREAFLADQGSSNNVGKSSISRYPVLFQTWTSSNVVLNICGDEAQISICSSKKPGLFTATCYVLEKHNIQILSAHISSDCTRCFYMIQAHVTGASDRFVDAIPVEEIYRQAAGELMCWVSS